MNQTQTALQNEVVLSFSKAKKAKKAKTGTIKEKKVIKPELSFTDEELKECLPKIYLPDEWQGASAESKLAILQRLEFLAETIKTFTKQVEENIVASIDAPEIDSNGILQSTAITEQGTLISSLYEWKQRETTSFNFDEAKAEGIHTEALYEKKPMTKTEITKELKAQYIPAEKIEKLFNVVKRSEPSLSFKKLK